MQYNMLAKLVEPRKFAIPKWHERERKSESYKKEQLKGLDTSCVSGRLRYWRIQKGISASELDKHLGLARGNYRRGFENPRHESSDIKKIKQICGYLQIRIDQIFDDYFRFLDSDYPATLSQLQAQLGYTKTQMAAAIGVSRDVYRHWLSGKKKPNRTSFQKIRWVMEGGGG